jgi:methionyl-tRNA synthetase
LSRACAKTLNPAQKFPQIHNEHLSELIKLDSCKALIERLTELPEKCHQSFTSYSFYLVVDSVMTALHAANNFFETTKPWELKNGDEAAKKKLETIISLTMEALRVSGIILQPIVPDYTSNLLQRLNIPQDQRVWKDTKLYLRKVSHNLVDLESNILFKRIILEAEKQEKPKSKKAKSLKA